MATTTTQDVSAVADAGSDVTHIFGAWPPIRGAAFTALCGEPTTDIDDGRATPVWPANPCPACLDLWGSGVRPEGWRGL